VGWSRTFPHPLRPITSTIVPGLGRFSNSPAADEYLAQLALGAVTSLKLGSGPGTDFLAISFSALDIVGHQFGPRSHEVQDTLARLDRTLGTFLDTLDKQVGKGRYVVALGADHGVALLAEQAKAAGRDAGRVASLALKQAAQKAAVAELGPSSAPYAVDVQTHEVYFGPGVHERLAARPGAIGRVLAALRAVPGVADAVDAGELGDPKDPLRKAAALSYFAGRSGDMLVLPRRDWTMGAYGTNHGTIYDYDQQVPVVLFGTDVKPGKYDQPASPADIAPTLARLVGVKLAAAEGRVLTEGLVAPKK
jgi:predicted AlkP superfamily pyrophosphatase or phosphodiesterase